MQNFKSLREIRERESLELHALHTQFLLDNELGTDDSTWPQNLQDTFADRMDAIMAKFQVLVDQFIDSGEDGMTETLRQLNGQWAVEGTDLFERFTKQHDLDMDTSTWSPEQRAEYATHTRALQEKYRLLRKAWREQQKN